MPKQYQTHLRNHVCKIMSAEKYELMRKASNFQYNCVRMWNPNIENMSEIVVSAVSLRDEIKTTFFGMAMIELLYFICILLQET